MKYAHLNAYTMYTVVYIHRVPIVISTIAANVETTFRNMPRSRLFPRVPLTMNICRREHALKHSRGLTLPLSSFSFHLFSVSHLSAKAARMRIPLAVWESFLRRITRNHYPFDLPCYNRINCIRRTPLKLAKPCG